MGSQTYLRLVHSSPPPSGPIPPEPPIEAPEPGVEPEPRLVSVTRRRYTVTVQVHDDGTTTEWVDDVEELEE